MGHTKGFTQRKRAASVSPVIDKPEHALVFGASGFLGQAVVDQLAATGCRLTVLVHRRMPERLPKGAHVIDGGLLNFSCAADDPPDVIFHCARLRGRGKWGRYLAGWRGNLANQRLLRTFGSARLVYASGSLMYGNCGSEPVLEDAPLRPISYAREYGIAERPFLRSSGVRISRPGWILGPGSWLEWFYLQPSDCSGAVPLYGTGNNLMSIIDRTNCAAAMIRIGMQGEPGVYHPPSIAVITQREFVELLAAELSLPLRQESLEGKERAVREAFMSSINVRSRHEAFWNGFAPCATDLRTALKDAISAYRARTRQSASRGSG